jgi:hypothetical protein
LAYKPERAQGQWHADVVSGKICWYGPNWRSFLPKPRNRGDDSQGTNNKSEIKVANPKADTQVVKRKPETEVENGKSDVRADDGKPVMQVENSKPDIQTENRNPEISAGPTSPLAEAVDSDWAQDSSGLRKATPVETAEITNAISLEFEPEPAVLNPAPPEMAGEPQSITDLLIAFSIIAIGTGGLVTLIMRSRGQQDNFDADVEEQPLEHMPVGVELAPSLQPSAYDERVSLEEPEHGFLTQSLD